MADLEQRYEAARKAGRARRADRRAASRDEARATPRNPSAARSDDSTATPPRAAAWYSGSRVSAADESAEKTGSQVKRTDARMRLRDGIQRFTGLDSVRSCETAPIGEAVGIRAQRGEQTGFAGLMRCASVWSCPVCAARIRGARAADLERYSAAWLKEGHGLYLLTLTVPHWEHVRLEDRVKDGNRCAGKSACVCSCTCPPWVPTRKHEKRPRCLCHCPVEAGQLSKLLEAWRGIAQGSWWVGRAVVRDGAPAVWNSSWEGDTTVRPRELEDGSRIVWHKGFAERYGIAGTTRTAEITDGANGWHSHLHALIWTEDPSSRETAEKLAGELSRRWASRCKAVGLPTPDPKVGCRVDPATRDKAGQAALARYIAKVQEKEADGTETARALASELVRGDTKLARGAKGRTPYDLAALAVAGDERARLRWREYERATKGRRCLTWTQGLQERLAELCEEELPLDDAELNDELAEQEAREPNLAVARQPFRTAVAGRRGGRADVAMAGYVGGMVAVEELLSEWGLLPGVDFWRLDPLGPGLPTSGPQVQRGREAREAKSARIAAADAVPTSRTPQEWARIQEARQRALQSDLTAAVPEVDDDQADERKQAHADFRARLRKAKARATTSCDA